MSTVDSLLNYHRGWPPQRRQCSPELDIDSQPSTSPSVPSHPMDPCKLKFGPILQRHWLQGGELLQEISSRSRSRNQYVQSDCRLQETKVHHILRDHEDSR